MAEKTREPSPRERSETLTRHRPRKAALHDLHCANYVCRAIVPEAAISLRKNFSAASHNAMDTQPTGTLRQDYVTRLRGFANLRDLHYVAVDNRRIHAAPICAKANGDSIFHQRSQELSKQARICSDFRSHDGAPNTR
jgi:hypothetical protein